MSTTIYLRRVRTVLLVLLSIASVASCSKAADNPAPTLDEVDIGYSRLRISLPVFVAKERGIFEKHGIQANLRVYDTAQPLMQALVEGQVDIAGYTALPITFNGMLRSNKELYFVTTMVEDQDHRISYLLRPATQPGQSPELNAVSDLKGKTIGILPTIAYRAWLEVILRQNGLDPDKDVTIQQVAPAQQPLTLKSGGVDALFTNDPAATSAIESGVAELLTDAVHCPKHIKDPFPFGSFNVSKHWADQNPELFRRLVAALDEAVTYVNQNPAAAKQAMIPYLPEPFRPHVAKYPDAKYLTTTESSVATFQAIAADYLKMGIIKQPLDLASLIVEGRP